MNLLFLAVITNTILGVLRFHSRCQLYVDCHCDTGMHQAALAGLTVPQHPRFGYVQARSRMHFYRQWLLLGTVFVT